MLRTRMKRPRNDINMLCVWPPLGASTSLVALVWYLCRGNLLIFLADWALKNWVRPAAWRTITHYISHESSKSDGVWYVTCATGMSLWVKRASPVSLEIFNNNGSMA